MPLPNEALFHPDNIRESPWSEKSGELDQSISAAPCMGSPATAVSGKADAKNKPKQKMHEKEK